MKKLFILTLLAVVCSSYSFEHVKCSDSPREIDAKMAPTRNDGYTVDEFYKKIELNYGSLDESGSSIDFVFTKTDLDAGKYEIELTDGPGDLYEITGTDIYITFNGYFGYAGYGTECILKVEAGYYSSTVFKIE